MVDAPLHAMNEMAMSKLEMSNSETLILLKAAFSRLRYLSSEDYKHVEEIRTLRDMTVRLKDQLSPQDSYSFFLWLEQERS